MPPTSPFDPSSPPTAAADTSTADDESLATTEPQPGRAAGLLATLRPHLRRVAATAGAAAGAIVIAGLLAVAWLWNSVDVALVEPLEESTVLLDRHGEELAVLSRDGTRLTRSLDELPDHVADALVAAEDRRFYGHDGVDLLAIGRAALNNVIDDDLEGGSTITQQLAKNRLVGDERTFSRKAREAVAAMKLERQLDKDEILEQYLNTVYFGRGAYGIEAAARAWFGIGADALDVAQSAFLMSILPAPEAFDPATDPDGAVARRDAVLDAMAEMEAVPRAVADDAAAAPLGVIDDAVTASELAPHFVEHVRAELLERFGEDAVYGGGLVVTTTLDLERQRAAVQAVDDVLDGPDDPQVALVSVEADGSVSAWVGGRDFEELQVDTVSAAGGSGRQPGSTFKPIVLARALADGIGAGTRYAAPAVARLDVDGQIWEVANAGSRDRGFLSLQQATTASVNTVYAQLALQLGPEAIAETASDLGITTDLRAHPSLALGAQEVAPIEVATVYATLARRGVRIDPYVIRTVEVDGEAVETVEPEARRAIDEAVADAVTHILSGTARNGTATRAALDRPMAAKTGTSQNNADGWLAGYTPELTTVVWIGDPDSTEPVVVDGEPLFGGSLPAEIWRRFMAAALDGVPASDFPEPDRRLLRDDAPSFSVDAPGRAAAGAPITVGTSGTDRCVSSWQLAIDGPLGEPELTVMRSELRDPGDAATFSMDLPAALRTGRYRVQLLCDTGGGGAVVARAEVQIAGVDPTTTTSTTTTTTTSTTSPSTTTTSTSTSTTSSTTTQPDRRSSDDDDRRSDARSEEPASTTTSSTSSSTTSTTAPEA